MGGQGSGRKKGHAGGRGLSGAIVISLAAQEWAAENGYTEELRGSLILRDAFPGFYWASKGAGKVYKQDKLA